MHSPGRELDILVAEKVMGIIPKIETYKTMGKEEYTNIPVNVPDYSTNIAAAWEIVEKMIEEGYDWELYSFKTAPEYHWRVFCRGFGSYEATAPLGICLAALKAKGVEIYGEIKEQ